MNKKHIEMRNKVKELLNRNLSEEEIAKKLKLKIGENSLEKRSVRWYKRCLEKIKCGKRTIQKLKIKGELKKWHSEGGKATIQKLRNEDRLKEVCRKGTIAMIKKLKKDSKYRERQSKAGKLGGKKAMQNRKARGIFKDFQRRASRAGLKAYRENKPYIFMGVNFDSNEEREFCKQLVRHKIIEKPIEGVNCHVLIGSKEVAFFLRQKFFVDYHPWDRKRSILKYYEERRKVLDEKGYKSYPLVIVENLKDFSKQILPVFKGE